MAAITVALNPEDAAKATQADIRAQLDLPDSARATLAGLSGMDSYRDLTLASLDPASIIKDGDRQTLALPVSG